LLPQTAEPGYREQLEQLQEFCPSSGGTMVFATYHANTGSMCGGSHRKKHCPKHGKR